MSARGNDPRLTSALRRARREIERAESARADGETESALDACDRALERTDETPEGRALRADALRSRAIVEIELGEYREAERDYRESLRLALDLSDPRRSALAEMGRAAVAFEEGRWPAAAARYETAEAFADAAGDRRLHALIRNNLGSLHSARGEHEKAEASLRLAIVDFGELGAVGHEARAWNNLGLSLVEQGRFDEAGDAYAHALVACERAEDRPLEARIRSSRAQLGVERGKGTAALGEARAAWTIAREMGRVPLAAEALRVMGNTARALDDMVEATRRYRRTLEYCEGGGAPLTEAETWEQIGRLYAEHDEPDRATDTLQFARHLYQRLGADAAAERLLHTVERLRTGVA